eukprot:scaffold5321_cov267-Pinguiococcus_pyrenoidosus.AAC.1
MRMTVEKMEVRVSPVRTVSHPLGEGREGQHESGITRVRSSPTHPIQDPPKNTTIPHPQTTDQKHRVILQQLARLVRSAVPTAHALRSFGERQSVALRPLRPRPWPQQTLRDLILR